MIAHTAKFSEFPSILLDTQLALDSQRATIATPSTLSSTSCFSPPAEEEGSFDAFDFMDKPKSVDYTIIESSQRNCDGLFSYHFALSIINFLNQKPQEAEAVVLFDKERLSTSLELSGGTCTAMALTFASRFFSKFNKPRFNELLSSKDFSAGFFQSNKYYRTLQAAYNTLTIRTDEIVDFATKFQKITEFHKLSIGSCSQLYTPPLTSLFKSAVISLTNGLYLLRLANPPIESAPESLIKQEHYGHSMIMIKKDSELPITKDFYLYDPNSGISWLKESDFVDWIVDKLNNYIFLHKFNKLQMIKLERD